MFKLIDTYMGIPVQVCYEFIQKNDKIKFIDHISGERYFINRTKCEIVSKLQERGYVIQEEKIIPPKNEDLEFWEEFSEWSVNKE